MGGGWQRLADARSANAGRKPPRARITSCALPRLSHLGRLLALLLGLAARGGQAVGHDARGAARVNVGVLQGAGGWVGGHERRGVDARGAMHAV